MSAPDPKTPAAATGPDQPDYRLLAEFRYLIRCFLEFSQLAAQRVGLTSRQHQALLAIKGFPGEQSPTIGGLAERLRIQPHSTVELVDRLAEAGLIERIHDPADHRRVRLGLTGSAERDLSQLSAIHLEELRRLGPVLKQILDHVGGEPR